MHVAVRCIRNDQTECQVNLGGLCSALLGLNWVKKHLFFCLCSWQKYISAKPLSAWDYLLWQIVSKVKHFCLKVESVQPWGRGILVEGTQLPQSALPHRWSEKSPEMKRECKAWLLAFAPFVCVGSLLIKTWLARKDSATFHHWKDTGRHQAVAGCWPNGVTMKPSSSSLHWSFGLSQEAKSSRTEGALAGSCQTQSLKQLSLDIRIWIRRDKGRSCTETNTAGMEAANNSSIRSLCNIKPCHHPWPCVWDRPIPAMFKIKEKPNHTVDQNYTSKTHCTFQRGLASI